jgi:hypothetical protein
MAYEASVLVVANVTAESRELLDAMRERGQRGPTAFTLLLPARRHPESAPEAQRRLDAALDQARQAGLEVTGQVGDADPVVAVSETFDPRKFDEIIVSTLPTGSSRWLAIDLPHRIERMTGVPCHHVVAEPPRPPVPSTPAPEHEKTTLISPLRTLGWGRRGGGGEPGKPPGDAA